MKQSDRISTKRQDRRAGKFWLRFRNGRFEIPQRNAWYSRTKLN